MFQLWFILQQICHNIYVFLQRMDHVTEQGDTMQPSEWMKRSIASLNIHTDFSLWELDLSLIAVLPLSLMF